MVIGPRLALQAGLSALLGLALAISLTSHLLDSYLEACRNWPIILLLTSILTIGPTFLLVRRLVRLADSGGRRWAMLAAGSTLAAGLLVAADWAKPRSMSWLTSAAGQARRIGSQGLMTWGESHPAIELHATLHDDPQWMWRVHAELPPPLTYFGGSLRLLVTVPDWEVFDELGAVRQGGDGVDVRVAVRRSDGRHAVQRLRLNLHAHSKERHWEYVDVPIAEGSQQLVVEALPGPPGSNNWYDRVWIAITRTDTASDPIIRLAEWASLSVLVFVACWTLGPRVRRALRERTCFAHRPPIPLRDALSDSLLLGFVVLSCLGPWVYRLGFYSDDWALLGNFSTSPDQSLSALFRLHYPDAAVRPVMFLYLAVLYRLFGLHPLGYHLANAAVLLSGVLLFYMSLRILTGSRFLSLTVPLVYAVLPHYSTDRLWMAAFQAPLSMALYFASLYSALRALEATPTGRPWWTLVALTALVASVLSYEVTAPLFLLNPLLLWYHARALGRSAARPMLDTPRWLPTAATNLIVLACVTLFKAVLTTRLRVRAGVFERLTTIPAHAVALDYADYDWGLNVRKAIAVGFGDYGFRLPVVVWKSIHYATVPSVILAAVCGLTACMYVHHVLRRRNAEVPGPVGALAFVVAGPILFLLGYATFLTTPDLELTASGIGNRTAIAAAIGVAVFWIGAIASICNLLNSDRLQIRCFSLLLGGLCATVLVIDNGIASFWVAAYTRQQEIAARIGDQFPAGPPAGSTLMLDGICPYEGPAIVFESSWDLAGMLQALYGDHTLQADVVTPALQVNADGLSTTLYAEVSHYPYNNLRIYNVSRGASVELVDAESVRRYFDLYPDRGRRCPSGREGYGVAVF
jgi:hypothetical protein